MKTAHKLLYERLEAISNAAAQEVVEMTDYIQCCQPMLEAINQEAIRLGKTPYSKEHLMLHRDKSAEALMNLDEISHTIFRLKNQVKHLKEVLEAFPEGEI